jgi:hypothetical protein
MLVALGLVSIVPLTVLTVGLRDANRDTLQDQVKKTHAVAVRAVARQVQGYLEQRLALASSLARNEIVVADPASEAAVETLSAVLQSNPDVLGIVVLGPGGEEVVRLQWPERADDVARAAREVPQTPVDVRSDTSPPVFLFTSDLAGSIPATLTVVDSGAALAGVLQPAELGQDTVLTVLDELGRPVVGESRGPLPPEVLEQVTSGRVNGSRVLVDKRGKSVVAAVWHLDAAPWAVVSTQPGATAEAMARQLDRRTGWAVGIALALTLLVAGAAYRGIVRPVRGILDAQRELGGVATPASEGSELSELKASFDRLAERVRERRELGRVFLGRYQVLELLGEGGMGTVFKGWDPRLHRLVALKTIQLSRVARSEAELERGAEATRDLLQEAVHAAQVSHPRIVNVYDVEDAPGCAYVAMELVEGPSLEHYLDLHGRLPLDQVAPLAAAVASALAAAHAEGLIHRDVKPANVLLSTDGSIKVGDFGIAAFLGSLQKSEELVFGTPGFMAPELIRGAAATVASDLFALGVLLYRSLSGRLPFRGESARKILLDTILRAPEPLARVGAQVAPEVEGKILSLLAKDPAARTSSADEVARWFGDLANEKSWRWTFDPQGRADFLPPERRSASSTAPSGVWPTIRGRVGGA